MSRHFAANTCARTGVDPPSAVLVLSPSQGLGFSVLDYGPLASSPAFRIPALNRFAAAVTNTIMEMRKICNHPYLVEGCEEQLTAFFGVTGPYRVNTDLLWRSAGKFELLGRIFPKVCACSTS